MRTSLHDLWGCGRGPVRRVAPQIRLVAGAAGFGGCMVSTGATLWGTLCAGGIAGAWVLACRPPWRILSASVLLGLALLLPYFLLVPWLAQGEEAMAGRWAQALGVPWTILVRGLCGMLVSVATVTSLSASELREALLRLPVPTLVSAILLQIVYQTATLFYETRRVAAAMAVRGAASGGTTAWRVLFSLPRVWLPRVLLQAERVGAAMELRGYCDITPRFRQRAALSAGDWVVLAAALGSLALAVAVRILDRP